MEPRKTVSTMDTRGIVIYTCLEYAPGVPVTIRVDFYGERPVVQWPPKTTADPRAARDFAEALALAARIVAYWSREPELPAEAIVARAERASGREVATAAAA
jgi:hypothetical protein